MAEVGTITGREIGLNQDAEKKTILVQVIIADENDSQTVEVQNSACIDIQPPDSARAFVFDVSDSYRIAVAVDDGVEPEESLDAGEIEIYSIDSGSRAAKIRMKKDGDVIVNDGDKSAVRFQELKLAFDQLKADHDILVAFVNALVLPVNIPALSAGPPAAQAPVSLANIDPAESESVKVP